MAGRRPSAPAPALLLPALLLGTAFAATVLVHPWSDARISDLPVYQPLAALFLDGSLPYRDVPFEYPPLAALAIGLPGLAGTSSDAYELGFGALALALAASLVALVGYLAARTGGDRRTALVTAALAPLLTGAMVRTHFDLAPVALTLGALVALVSGRTRLAFVALGLGVMTKGFPLVVAPVALAWLAGRGARADAKRGAAALIATVMLIAAAWLAVSPSGALEAVRFHLERPIQLESSPASALLALDAAGAGRAEIVHVYGSHGVSHPAAGIAAGASAALVVAAVAWLTLAVARRRPGSDPGARSLVLASLAAVAAFAALGKVLSPQFLVWVVPLLALALAWRMYALAASIALALALTLTEFPARYFDLVALGSFPVLLVGARNLALLLAVALAARALAPAVRVAAGPEPAPARP